MRGPSPVAASATVLVAVLAVALVLSPIAALPLAADGRPAPATTAPASVSTPDLPAQAAPGRPSAREPTRPAAPDRSGPRLLNPVTPEANTTAYLALEGERQRSRIGTATLDAAASVAADGARTRGAYRTAHLQQSFAAAEGNRSAQRAVVRRSARRLDSRIAALERWEAAALERYNAGEISTRSYLRELAAIDAGAESARDTATLLSTYSAAVGNPVAQERIASFKARLLPLEGPVRELARDAMTGEALTTRVYVETTAEGVVLAAVERGPFVKRYIREATVPSARDPSGGDEFAATGDGLGAARDRVRDLCPWVAENQNGLNIGTFGGEPYLYRAGVYSVAIDHPHGTSRTGDLVTFLDGSTREPFHEIQYKDLSTVPTKGAGGNTSDNITLSVARTRSGGPMRVSVRNATSGDPLTARVQVDGEPAGVTGLDGSRWLIAPRSTARITVTTGNATVSTVVFTEGSPTGS